MREQNIQTFELEKFEPNQMYTAGCNQRITRRSSPNRMHKATNFISVCKQVCSF